MYFNENVPEESVVNVEHKFDIPHRHNQLFKKYFRKPTFY